MFVFLFGLIILIIYVHCCSNEKTDNPRNKKNKYKLIWCLETTVLPQSVAHKANNINKVTQHKEHQCDKEMKKLNNLNDKKNDSCLLNQLINFSWFFFPNITYSSKIISSSVKKHTQIWYTC